MIVTVNKAVENKSSHCRQNITTKGMLMFARSQALINFLDKRLENSNKSILRTKHTKSIEKEIEEQMLAHFSTSSGELSGTEAVV